jgi:bacteriocin biosynthesis cyclodehydratase domain-containing protein
LVEINGGVTENTLLGVAEGLDLVFISDNELLIQFGTRSRPSELLRDADLTGVLKKTVGRLLQAPATLAELLEGVEEKDRADTRKLLNDLIGRGIITDLRRTPVQQYLRYTLTGESTLEERSVGLIGTGPIGVRIAHSLLLHGISRLLLLDDRKPDELWRSFLPLDRQSVEGASHTSSEVLRDALLAAGHQGVQDLPGRLDPAGIEAAVVKSDFSVVALEQPNLRLAHLVNRFCIRHRKPWMLTTIDGNFGLVGPLFLPLHTACYNDYQVLANAATPSPAMARKHRQHIDGRVSSGFFPGLPAYVEILAGFSSLAIVDFLLRGTTFALGRVVVMDFDGMAIEVEDVLKLPRCPVCGRERSAYRPAFSPHLISQASEGPALPRAEGANEPP